MARRIKLTGVDPAFLEKQRASLLRKNRQVLYLNDKEMEAITQYCDRFGVRARSVLFRESIMEKVLSALNESHPTLF